MNTRAFQIHPADNVAVLMEDSIGGVVTLIGQPEARTLAASEPIRSGHKIALIELPPGNAIIKYGVRIGHAVTPIHAGDWVHLHNCASDLDERSGTLDNDSGAPTDTIYE